MPNSLVHKTWRKVAKKVRRKRIRQRLAIERDRLAPTTEENIESDQDENPEIEARISADNHQKWLEREALAQQIFREAERKREEAERAREQERQRIKAEYEAEIQR